MDLKRIPGATIAVKMLPREVDSDAEDGSPVEAAETTPVTKFRIYKNLIVVSVGTMVILGTDDLMGSLQSSINKEEGIGVTSMTVQTVIICITSLLMPKYLIHKIGSKAVLILAVLAFVPFYASNYYPSWYVMIPSSILLGIGFSLVWSSVCAYLSNLSELHADYCKANANILGSETSTQFYTPSNCNSPAEEKVLQENDNSKVCFSDTGENNVLSNDCEQKTKTGVLLNVKDKTKKYIFHSKRDSNIRANKNEMAQLATITSGFFSIHSMIYQTCYVWSNLLSYYILQRDSRLETYASNSNCSCGAEYCNIDTDCSETNLQQPSEVTRTILISVCIALALGAAVFLGIFFENFKPKKTNVTFSLDFLLATLKQTRKRDLALLIPLTVYTGMMRGFYVSDFTKSYIGCAWGIRYIGLVTICSGITMAVSSSLSGWFVKHLGRFKLFMIGGLLNVVVISMLLIWKPDHNYPFMFFMSSGLFGCVYGIFLTQLRAYYGVLFKGEEEAVFGAFNLWNPIGTFMSFAYSNLICNSTKLYLLMLFSNIGILGYIIVEKSYLRRDTKSNDAS